MRLILATCFSMVLPYVACLSSARSADVLSDRFNSVALPDCFGNTHRLGDLRDSHVIVVAFLGTECPLAKLYGPRLQTLSEQFRDDGVTMVGVFSNVQDSLSDVVAYTNKSGISFPMLMDNDQQLADLLHANRTPEVFVLDRNQTIQYQGRIDDQYAISVARKTPTSEDLAESIQSILKGETPPVAVIPSVGCVIGRKHRIEPHGEITFAKHIAPIMNARCVECHRVGEIAPFPLTSYEETVGWEATISEAIREERMPPWHANPEFGHFKNDARLSGEEKRLIQTWIDNGCPKGNESDLPPSPTFVTGWRMPEPDMVIHLRDEPFKVPATGVVDYQYFKVDPKFSEDKYVVAAEARPGNASVVHHIIAYMVLPGQKDTSLGKMLIGYSPGTSPLIFPNDSAIFVPAGTQILFEVHYTPNGTEQTDRSYIGLKFTDASSVKNFVVGLEAIGEKLQIPPGAANHIVTAQQKVHEDVTLLSLTPHMHLRGKAFRYVAKYPDGTEETLLDLPKYDFNWQLRYEFAEPKLIPKGTIVKCTAAFDNSSGNPNNPDPAKEISWGQQSWDEMMIGFLAGVRPRTSTTEQLTDERKQ